MEKGPFKSRPDYHQTTRATVSMNIEASQIQESKRRHNYREDLDPKKFDWLIWLSHNWKRYFAANQIPELNSTQWHHQKSTEEHASVNRETFTHDDRWIANWWTASWWGRNQDGHGMTKSKDFFLDSGFGTHIVATAVCATGSAQTLHVARTLSL